MRDGNFIRQPPLRDDLPVLRLPEDETSSSGSTVTACSVLRLPMRMETSFIFAYDSLQGLVLRLPIRDGNRDRQRWDSPQDQSFLDYL